jgi:hypothetical protein
MPQIFSRLTGQASLSSRSVAPTALKFSGRIAAWLVEMTSPAAAGLEDGLNRVAHAFGRAVLQLHVNAEVRADACAGTGDASHGAFCLAKNIVAGERRKLSARCSVDRLPSEWLKSLAPRP